MPQYENTYRMEPTRKPTRKELTNLFEKVLSDIPSEKANSPDFPTGVKVITEGLSSNLFQIKMSNIKCFNK